MIVIDNTLLIAAAEQLELPHCPQCLVRLDRWHPDAPTEWADEVCVVGWSCPTCEEDLDADFQGVCEDTARQLREVASAAETGADRSPHGWPAVTVQVQGCLGDGARLAAAPPRGDANG